MCCRSPERLYYRDLALRDGSSHKLSHSTNDIEYTIKFELPKVQMSQHRLQLSIELLVQGQRRDSEVSTGPLSGTATFILIKPRSSGCNGSTPRFLTAWSMS